MQTFEECIASMGECRGHHRVTNIPPSGIQTVHKLLRETEVQEHEAAPFDDDDDE